MGDTSRTDELELILWVVSADSPPNVLIVRPSGDPSTAEANGFVSATCADMKHMCECDAEETEATKEHLEYVHDWMALNFGNALLYWLIWRKACLS